MTTQFGARLRQQREQQQLSLASIAEKTKIKLSLLDALEQGDISHWPPGIFRRAYVRAYANAIGLDADTAVREFLEVFPEPVVPEIVETPAGLRGFVGSALGSLSRIRRPALTPADRHPAKAGSPIEHRLEGPIEGVPTMGRVPAVEVAPLTPVRTIDLLDAARVCTELGRVTSADQLPPLVAEAAAILDAKGLIVWVWDAPSAQLRPVLVHGYSAQVVAQLPPVGRDAANLTAAAFRSASTMAVAGAGDTSGALALPLLTPSSCAGVLTIELPHGTEEAGDVRAVATFIAAMLAQLVGGAAPEACEPAVAEPDGGRDEPAYSPRRSRA